MRGIKPKAAFLMLLCSFLAAAAQLLYKVGAGRLQLDFWALATNYPLIIGGMLYLASAALMTMSLKHGKLSVIYPLVSLAYIWVTALSVIFLNEQVSLLHWGGVAVIILGVSLIGAGSDGA